MALIYEYICKNGFLGTGFSRISSRKHWQEVYSHLIPEYRNFSYVHGFQLRLPIMHIMLWQVRTIGRAC
jgi:hypothetical protein